MEMMLIEPDQNQWRASSLDSIDGRRGYVMLHNACFARFFTETASQVSLNRLRFISQQPHHNVRAMVWWLRIATLQKHVTRIFHQNKHCWLQTPPMPQNAQSHFCAFLKHENEENRECSKACLDHRRKLFLYIRAFAFMIDCGVWR